MRILIEEHFVEIIGIVGALLGVGFGAFLTRLSRIGRVKSYINKVQYNISKKDRFGGLKSIESITKETVLLSINIDMDLFNSSEYSKRILRDIKFKAIEKSYRTKRNIVDNSTRRMLDSLSLVDDLKFVNLNPKEMRNLNLSVSFDKEFEELLNSKWYLTYKNSNNRTRKIDLINKRRKFSGSSRFEQHK